MKNTIMIMFGVLLFTNCHIANSQTQKHLFEIKSDIVEGETYPIEVVLPDDYDSTLRYPIVYVTDWWFSSTFVTQLYNSLNDARVVQAFIMVGISNQGEMKDWRQERLRDLTPTNIPEYDKPDSLVIGSKGITGGASKFLKFIKDELIPVVEKKYLSDTLNRGLAGYSLGGLFSSFALLNEPQLFSHYLIGSPSLAYDDFIMIDKLKEIAPQKLLTVRNVFIAVGEEESGNALKGFADFRDILLKKDLPNLKLESIIVDGEGHSLASYTAVIKGFKFMYGRER